MTSDHSDEGARDLVALRNLATRHPGHDIHRRMARTLAYAILDRSAEGDAEGRDALLAELRDLSASGYSDNAVHEQLARALLNIINDHIGRQDPARRTIILSELRNLATRHPGDTMVRKRLARALLNTISDQIRTGDVEGRNAQLTELRDLASNHPDDAAIRHELAWALFIALDDHIRKSDTEAQHALLSEIRELARSHHDDPVVRERFAMALGKTLDRRSTEDERQGRADPLEELRDLATSNPTDEAVRRELGSGLLNAYKRRLKQGNREGCDALLIQLRELASKYPGNVHLAEFRNRAERLHEQNAHLVELRDLATKHPGEDTRDNLASALMNMVDNHEIDAEGRNALLAELRDLATRSPDATAVRNHLNRALFTTFDFLLKAADADGCNAILREIRDNATSHPEDAVARTRFAMALGAAVRRGPEVDLERQDTLLGELRDLATKHPDDDDVLHELVWVLRYILQDRAQKGDREVREAVITELRHLATSHPNNKVVREELASALKTAQEKDGLTKVSNEPPAPEDPPAGEGLPSVDQQRNRTRHSDDEDSPFKVVLDYTLQCFEAEEENSRQHLEFTKMMMGAMVAVVVLGLFTLGLDLFDGQGLQNPWQAWQQVLLFSALVCFVLSFWSLLWGRSRFLRSLWKMLRALFIWALRPDLMALRLVWAGASGVWPRVSSRQPFKSLSEAINGIRSAIGRRVEPLKLEIKELVEQHFPPPDPNRFHPATGHLSLLEEDLDALPAARTPSDRLRELAILRSAKSLGVLFSGNVQRDEAIRRAKQWFVLGVMALVLTLFLYTEGAQQASPPSEAETESPEGDSGRGGEDDEPG